MVLDKKGEINMNQVLILTRNVLAEQEIQQKLQSLNYEVYCSSKVFDTCISHRNNNVVQLSGKVSLIGSNYLQGSGKYNEINRRIIETLHRLSQTESKILSILIEAGNQVVTREEICHKVWNEDVTKSHLASLSSTVTRIKTKFEQGNLEKIAIHTLWGKGYRINQNLLNHLQGEELLKSIVSVSNG